MIAYPPSLQAVGGARTGIAPVNLLDVLDVNGNFYFWSDRRVNAPIAILAAGVAGSGPGLSGIDAGGRWVLVPPADATPTTAEIGSGECYGTSWASYAVAAAGSDGGTGQLTLTGGCPLGTPSVSAEWSGFSAPTLPEGAVVTGIFPAVIATGSFVAFGGWGIVQNYTAGSATPSTTYPATPTATPADLAAGHCPSLGASLSIIPDVALTIQDSNTDQGSPTDNMLISQLGLKVYYTLPGGGAEPGADYPAPPPAGIYEPWLLTIPQLTFHRSSVTDVGSFVLQNLSGDTISRDFEKIMRRSALEGAYFIYRCWQPDAQAAWIYADGTLTVDDVGVDTVTLKGAPAINPAQEDSPELQFSETCQWRWKSPQCGATGDTECGYSYQSCQVLDRILVVLNDYEKNYGETTANVPTQTVNRRRRF